jgi:hypothetical protein
MQGRVRKGSVVKCGSYRVSGLLCMLRFISVVEEGACVRDYRGI